MKSLKDKLQNGLFEVKTEPEKKESKMYDPKQPVKRPCCVDGVCQCDNDEQGFRHIERRTGKICEDPNCNCEPEDELEDQEEE